MRWISDILWRLKATFLPGRMERELDEEMAFHVEMEARKLERAGYGAEEALRLARRRFGEPVREKERAREAWGISLVRDLRSDARHTLRQLRRSPVFAVVSILTMALGTGGATAIFTVLDDVVLRPLPFLDADRLVAVHHSMPGVGQEATPLSPAMYRTYREHARTLEEVGLWKTAQVTVTGNGDPERVDALQVTEGLFPLLGVAPVLGRGYTAEDVEPGGGYPVILSHAYWLRRFNGDASAVGGTLRISGKEYPIIGVMPSGFRIGDERPDIYIPLVFRRYAVGNWSYPGMARIRPGHTLAEVGRELTGLTELATEEYPGIPLAELEGRSFRTFVRPLKDELVGGTGTVLWIVFASAGLVLLIACANVANLFLVRAEGRERDVALRSAMGASRWRLVRQFLTEGAVIAALGGGAGLLLAYAGVGLLRRLAPVGLPRLDSVAVDGQTLAFAVSVAAFTGIVFGMIPALRPGSRSLVATLKEGGRGRGAPRGSFRGRNAFAVVQVLLAVVLLVGSGLLVRSFHALRGVPPGFQRPEQVLTFRLSVPSSDAPTGGDVARMHRRIMDEIAGIAGVTHVAAAFSVGMEGPGSWDDILVDGMPASDPRLERFHRINWVTPGYFATLENPVLAGREIDWTDIQDRRPVGVVTENMARELWGEPERALGHRIRNSDDEPWREIVGVVGNVYARGVAEEAPQVVYWPVRMRGFWGDDDFAWGNLRYAVRTAGREPLSILGEVRRAVRTVNPDLPVFQVATLDRILADSMASTSFTLFMLALAAGMALVLGVVGVYGVIAYMVARRTPELGVRMALGSTPGAVRRLVLRQGVIVAAAGVILGLGVSVGLSRFLAMLLFGVDPVDPATYAAAALALGAAVLLATYIPARRAAAVNPTDALRWE